MFAVLESELVVLGFTQSLSIIAKNLTSGLVFSVTSDQLCKMGTDSLHCRNGEAVI